MGTSVSGRAALYLRQSLDRAEGIELQRKRCAALARARGWQIIDSFADNETKASEERGPETGWGRMLSRVGQDFDIIVSVDLDRLARNTRDLNKLIDLGAAVVTVDGEIDLASADGEFRATMIVSVARFETRRASERQRRHKAAKAERGEWHGGIPPYGYTLDQATRTLVPSENEVKVIKEAARRLLDLREPLYAITNDWNDRGVTTRFGKHWRQANLRPILLNRALLGETKAGVQGWAPIIDVATFDRLNALLTDPSRRISTYTPGANGTKYSMAGGLSVCAKCGKPLVSSLKTGRGETGKQAVLGCLKRVHGPSEHHPQVEREVTIKGEKVKVKQDTARLSILHDTLEEYVFGKVIDRLNDQDYWRRRKAERDPGADSKIAILDARRTALFEKRERAEDLALDGLLSKERLREQITAIEAEVVQIAKDIDALVGRPDIEAIYGRRDTILANWRKWSSAQRRSFLRLVITRVVVDEWPAGIKRASPRRKTETSEQYRERRHAEILEAVDARVTIEWRED